MISRLSTALTVSGAYAAAIGMVFVR